MSQAAIARSRIAGVVAGWAVLLAATTTVWTQERPPDFGRDVRPILSEYCFTCHGPDAGQRQAGLRLDVRESATGGLESGKFAIVPGQPGQSEIIRRVANRDDGQMPPAETGKRLSESQQQVLARWIAAGAKYEEHWAFVAPLAPELPAVGDISWPRNEVDRFILARLEAADISPSREAAAETLVRRLSFDLTGLPPTIESVDLYMQDRSPDAYERMVDRLLASPHYGEQRARDWLDAARYADTHGFFTDHERFMWRWREWVIDAYNHNLPFDQFTIEQLAGDLLPKPTIEQRIATGFNRNLMVTEETGVIPEEYRTEYVADRVRTTAAVWMGLTAGCAQCHDHKYDPLTQREYFQMFAYFNNVPETGISGGKKNAPPLLDLATSEEAARRMELRKQIVAQDAKLKPRRATEDDENDANDKPEIDTADRAAMEAQRARLLAEERQLLLRTTAMVMQEQEKTRETFVLMRGQYDQPGEQVLPGVPAFLLSLPATAPGNRLGFAQWLVDPRHPLTARVAVNRHWRQVFGEGLVNTLEDFGVRGEPPSHPELLDWLATRLVTTGWDVKGLERRLVCSATYRQASAVTTKSLAGDSSNRLWGRASRRRLTAEEIRDSALVAANCLMMRIGGPSVKPYQPTDLWKHITYDTKNTQIYDQSTGEGLFRRSVYSYWKRQIPPPTMQLLDAPSRETCVLRRQRTNTPLQALALLNDTQFVEAARGLALRMLGAAGDDAERVAFGFRLVTARRPTVTEIQHVVELLVAERLNYRDNPAEAESLVRIGDAPAPSAVDRAELAAWTVVGNLLLNLDEVISRE